MLKNNFYFCFLLICSFFLISCGFHLRGNAQLPHELQHIYVSYSSPNDPLVLLLKHTLQNSKVQLAEDAEHADYILRINNISKNSTLQASSTTGQLNSYLLSMTANFELSDKYGNTLLHSQQAQSNASYTLGSNTVVANNTQEQMLIPELYRDITNQILLRLGSKQVAQKVAKNTMAQQS